MGVLVSKYKTTPELEYKYFFAERIVIEQERVEDDTAMPVFNVGIQVRMYALDADRKRHFDNKVSIIPVDNFLELAMLAPQAQEISLMEVMSVIEYAVAKIAELTTDIGETQVI